MAAQGVFSTLCVPVLGISVRAYQGLVGDIENEARFFVWRKRALGPFETGTERDVQNGQELY